VKDVIISKKLTSSPVCISVGEGDMDIRMERFLIEQKQLHKSSSKILEINISHPILCKMSDAISSNTDTMKYETILWLLFDQACILEGEPVKDVTKFSKRLIDLLQVA